MSDKINVKVKMPMIPLRDVVIFPNTVSTLFVGREKSIFSLEDALRTNKKIFLVNPSIKEKITSARMTTPTITITKGTSTFATLNPSISPQPLVDPDPTTVTDGDDGDACNNAVIESKHCNALLH